MTQAMDATASSTAATVVTTIGVHGADAVEQRLQRAAQEERARQPEQRARAHDQRAFAQHEPEDARSASAERHANADLAASLRHLIREHTVDADCGKEQRHGARSRRPAASGFADRPAPPTVRSAIVRTL